MSTPINTILSWFETGDFPTEDQFAASWTSFYHKDESIPMDKVENLNGKLLEKVDKSVYNAHLSSENAHITTLAKLDASNLNANNIQAWKTVLGVGELPPNIALIDDIPNALQGNVYTKQQSNTLYMALETYVNGNGKILAGMIEALGLTDLIEAVETTIAAFAANSGNYTFQDNDFIAIPNNGSYFLYMYKGGSKTTVGNYLPTGLTNITIAMVQGLQAALDAKLDKPSGNGNYFVNRNGAATGYRIINPTSNYLLFWNGTDFTASDVYNNSGKYGVGTTSPSEMLHLNNGRIRSKAVVFDENTEALPFQITHKNRAYYGSDLTGTQNKFMYQNFADYKTLWQNLTDAEKTEIKTIANGGWTTNTMSVGLMYPPIVPKATNPNNLTFITLIGSNLNLNPANFTVKVINSAGTVVETINNSKVTLLNANMLNFSFNSQAYALGDYRVTLWNGLAEYTTSVIFTVIDGSSSANVDISGNTWTRVTAGDLPFDAELIRTSNEVAFSSDADLYAAVGNNYNAVVVAYYSQVYLNSTDDFVIEGDVTKTGQNYNPFGGSVGFGITLSNTNTLSSERASGAAATYNNSPVDASFSAGNNTVGLGNGDTMRFIVSKRANYITTTIFKSNGQTSIGVSVIDNNTPIDIRFKIFATHFQYTPNATLDVKINSIRKI